MNKVRYGALLCLITAFAVQCAEPTSKAVLDCLNRGSATVAKEGMMKTWAQEMIDAGGAQRSAGGRRNWHALLETKLQQIKSLGFTHFARQDSDGITNHSVTHCSLREAVVSLRGLADLQAEGFPLEGLKHSAGVSGSE
jgi:hypothetical protein